MKIRKSGSWIVVFLLWRGHSGSPFWPERARKDFRSRLRQHGRRGWWVHRHVNQSGHH